MTRPESFGFGSHCNEAITELRPYGLASSDAQTSSFSLRAKT